MKKNLNNNMVSVVVGLLLIIGALYIAIGPEIKERFITSPTEEYSDYDDDDDDDDYDDDYDEEENTDDGAEDGDITKLSDTPTASQETTLSLLAQQRFDEVYPYKGSKMHKITGVHEEWSGGGESWLFEVDATIVNAAGAERETTLVIEIFPSGPKEGKVTIAEY